MTVHNICICIIDCMFVYVYTEYSIISVTTCPMYILCIRVLVFDELYILLIVVVSVLDI